MESILQNNGCFLRKIQRCFTRRDFLSTQEWRQKTKPLRRKVKLNSKRGNTYIQFESDDELSYPEGTPITIWHRQEKEEGSIVGCEEFTIIIETKAKLGKDIPSIDISAEPWRLLNSLIERLTIMKK